MIERERKTCLWGYEFVGHEHWSPMNNNESTVCVIRYITKVTTESSSSLSHLDYLLKTDSKGKTSPSPNFPYMYHRHCVTLILMIKKNNTKLPSNPNFPCHFWRLCLCMHLYKDIPLWSAYGFCIFQLIQYRRACSAIMIRFTRYSIVAVVMT
jgi:hypothetical protein